MSKRLLLGMVTIGAWIATSLLTRDTSIHLPMAVVSVLLMLAAFVIDGPNLRLLLVVRASDVGVGLVGGLAMAAATRLLYLGAIQLFPALVGPVAVLYETMRDAPPLPLTLPLMAIIITCEEVVWRGVLVRDRTSVVTSALGYTVAQLGAPSLLLAPIALGCGLLWGAERLHRRGLVAPLLTHMVWNALTLVYFPLDRPL